MHTHFYFVSLSEINSHKFHFYSVYISENFEITHFFSFKYSSTSLFKYCFQESQQVCGHIAGTPEPDISSSLFYGKSRLSSYYPHYTHQDGFTVLSQYYYYTYQNLQFICCFFNRKSSYYTFLLFYTFCILNTHIQSFSSFFYRKQSIVYFFWCCHYICQIVLCRKINQFLSSFISLSV